MTVERVHEDPRVTKPYTDDAVGGDRRRSAGGSTRRSRPATCASRWAASRPSSRIDDLDGDGVEHGGARARASAARRATLVRRLRDALRAGRRCSTSARASGTRASRCRAGRSAATGARDGEPVWSDPGARRRRRRRLPATAATTRTRFVAALARAARRRSGARASPATRTSGTTSGASGGCRLNVDPLDVAPRRSRGARAARARLRAGARQASSAARCRSRPRRRAARWRSGPWFLRAGAHVPRARRLADGLPPAARLAAVGRARRPRHPASSATRWRRATAAARRHARTRAARTRRPRRRPHGAPLGSDARARRRRRSAPRSASSRATAGSTSSCRRSRRLEDYLDLVAAVEDDGARRSALPVVVEGYPPPADPRLRKLEVTPDPGVHRGERPSRRELGRAGRASRTGALRGGAPVPARHREVHARRPPHRHRRRQPRRRSAARRRPTARSCAAPTCCAACSPTGTTIRRSRTSSRGLFIGPTSQAPRVDEARDDSALRARDRVRRRCPERAATRRPGSSTALFRHLLVDVTGNTHRAEFCIDKLYSPDARARPARAARAARLRDAAARAHEPGAAAAAARARRALLEDAVPRAAGALGHARCTTASCCRTSSGRTSPTCSRTCAQRRLPARRAEWFAPHLEFRFPLIGSVDARAASQLELRAGARAVARARRGGRRGRHGRATSTRRSSACR